MRQGEFDYSVLLLKRQFHQCASVVVRRCHIYMAYLISHLHLERQLGHHSRSGHSAVHVAPTLGVSVEKIEQMEHEGIVLRTAEGYNLADFGRPCYERDVLSFAYLDAYLRLFTTSAEPVLLGGVEIIITDNLRTQAL